MKHSKQKKQQGFTLIELMIVVAVIGVLAAIAIPQYQNYVAKSELGAGLATITSVRTNVEDYIVTNGSFPDGTTTGQKTTDLGVIQPQNGTITFDKAKGNILLSFATTGNSPDVNSAKIALNRATGGTWTCKATLDEKLLPKSCAKDASL
ncbi:TPA: pilin [Vibrio parahaemolyticus]|uniref:pilin n=1 Tax=Vibrio parahaemolyticus TaxID=670 RepID=UPI0011249CB0|nr:pilin [Vibrio parahaemolyticus]TOG46714.1 prepilin-type cleavage/methylation domain-containing protein [Vibrio parahaemolyticus]TOP16656.1 prepilin-type cleavage/methylation domain-containing protein [Vibrio parahaemolyticus]TOQ50328.1 prepilin-type cleavage/methylation domain-containing protein [Vibrio parahaemolyticus]HCE2179469.1 pilin [Vibrio parahaemolyticus]HCG7052122.1 pilin [Vibrio parahaemolyticus]